MEILSTAGIYVTGDKWIPKAKKFHFKLAVIYFYYFLTSIKDLILSWFHGATVAFNVTTFMPGLEI